jgi:pyruvate/2-oxoglutarate dehydrogenase complex dihydrolipoamide dehydrogenase (E3) component
LNDILKPDLCVIGGGAGGLSVAAAAAALGVSTVLVEKAEMGGDCLNVGCVPSKSLLASAAAADAQRASERFGIRAHEPRVDYGKIRDHIAGVIAAIAPNDSAERFAAIGVTVIRAAARFTSPAEVVAGNMRIRARRVVIASGSSPRIPDIPGLDAVRFLTNENVFALRELPTRLIIIGAGATGIELAQAFRRLGSDVVVLEIERALATEDPELAAPVLDRLTLAGIELREGSQIRRIEPRYGVGVRVVLAGEVGEDGETIDASHILVAAGRKPNVEGLGLEAGQITYDKMGVKVSRSLRSVSNRKVFAAGDVAAIDGRRGPQFTHVASYHAGIVVKSAVFRLRAHVLEHLLPRVLYTDPEIASVGLNELEARGKYRSIQVLRWPFAENDRAQTSGCTIGHVKVITDKGGIVLGAGIVGSRASELITPWTIAIRRRLNLSVFADVVFPYPTLSEVSRRVALLPLASRATNPWVVRLVRVLRSFG